MISDHAPSEYSCQDYSCGYVADMRSTHENLQMEGDLKAFGRGLRKVRNERHLTQEQLEEASGVSQAAISKIELGKQEATTSVMRDIAKALGVPVSEIWRHAEGGAAGPVKTIGPVGVAAKPTLQSLGFAVAALFSLVVLARPREAASMAASMRNSPDAPIADPFLQSLLEVLDRAAATTAKPAKSRS